MKGIFLLLLCCIPSAAIGTLIKLLGENVHPISQIFYRSIIAVFILFLVCKIFKKEIPRIKKTEIKEYATVGFLFYFSSIFIGLAVFYMSIQLTTVVLGLIPLCTVILGLFLLNEKITLSKIVTIIIALAGIIILNPLGESNSVSIKLGLMFAGIGVILSALYYIYSKKLEVEHSIGSIIWIFFFSAIFSIPTLFYFGFGNVQESYLLLIAYGFVTAATYFLLNLALETVEAGIATIILSIISPIISIFLGVLVFGEVITLQLIAGATIIIFSGVYLEVNHKIHFTKFHFFKKHKKIKN